VKNSIASNGGLISKWLNRKSHSGRKFERRAYYHQIRGMSHPSNCPIFIQTYTFQQQFEEVEVVNLQFQVVD
jgi:hypothetical protein